MKVLKQSWKYVAALVGLGVLVLLIMDFNTRMSELNRLSLEKERVSVQVTSLYGTKQALETQIAYATTEAAVAEWAGTYGHMARPGEVLVVPLAPEGSAAAAEPTPAVTQRAVQNWQVWLALFIDQPAP